MSKLKTRRLVLTTDSGGDATANDTLSIVGRLVAIEYAIGTLDATTTDVTVSVQSTESAVALTLLTLTNVTASSMYYVRHLAHGEAGAALTGTAGGDRVAPVLNGTLRAVVAQGGNAKTGAVIVYYEPGR